jgi:hypothetical protein
MKQSPPCSTDGRKDIKVAIPWIRRKHRQPKAFLSFENQLCCDDYTTFLDRHAATLFVQTSQQAIKGAIAMPNDPNREWLPLHSTSRHNRGNYDSYVARFPIRQIQLIARGDLFAQLAGGHYFLFPILHNEANNCEQAMTNLALNMWDNIHGIQTTTVIYPDGYLDTSTVMAPNVTTNLQIAPSTIRISPRKDSMKPNITNKRSFVPTITEAHLPSTVAKTSATNGMTNFNNQAGQAEQGLLDNINRCYGRDPSDQARLSLGILSITQMNQITSLQQGTTKVEFSNKLFQLLSTDNSYTYPLLETISI